MDKKTYLYKITAKVDVSENMSDHTAEVMRRHFQYLKELLENGILFLAGPCLDREFGIAIFYADSDEEAEAIMKKDPSISEGVMNGELHPFRISLSQSSK